MNGLPQRFQSSYIREQKEKQAEIARQEKEVVRDGEESQATERRHIELLAVAKAANARADSANRAAWVAAGAAILSFAVALAALFISLKH